MKIESGYMGGEEKEKEGEENERRVLRGKDLRFIVDEKLGFCHSKDIEFLGNF